MLARTRMLNAALLIVTLLGPIFFLLGILSRGLTLLNAAYPRLGFTYVALALSAGSAAYLAFRRGHMILRLVGGIALLLNLVTLIAVGSLWAREMRRAIAEAEMVPVEPGKVGILVAPAGQSARANDEARDVENAIRRIVEEAELDPFVTVQHIYPISSESHARRVAERMRAHVVVWKKERGLTLISSEHFVTVLGASETEVKMEPLDLMLFLSTQDSLVIKSTRERQQEDSAAVGVIAPLAAGFGGLALGRPMLAAAQFQTVLQSGLVPTETVPSLQNHYGTALMFLHRPELALGAYQASNEIAPNTRGWLGIGNVRLALRDWDGAMEAYGQAIAIDPYDAAPYCGVAVVHARMHKVSQALAVYRQAISIDPTCAPAYALMGLAYELGAQIEPAREAYQTGGVYAGPNAAFHGSVLDRAEYILRNPPTAVPTATPIPLPTVTPIPTSSLYTVEGGDTLQGIASDLGVSVDEIIELNKLVNPNNLSVGQTLLIPKKR